MMCFIAIFILAFLAGSTPLAAQEVPGKIAPQEMVEETPLFKAGVADVRLDVQVTQGKDLVEDLTKDNFVVTEEGQRQELVSFSHGDERLNLILLLDISGSMQSYIEEMARTAREALSHLRPGDRVAIMVFAKKTAIHQGFSDNLAETARQIGSAVKDWDVGTTTMINSAVVDAAHYMQKHAGPEGRRAILILTDNLSTSYRLTDGQVIRELGQADTVFNAIVTGHAIRPDPDRPGADKNPDYTAANVFHVAEETGGEWVKAGEAGQTFNEMIRRIRTRYMLAYHEPPGQPGFRRVQVIITADAMRRYPAAEIRVRSGYYAQQ